MSATFKLANQKKQDELRRMMAQHKEKVKKPATINNPLAKYNDAGQLMCILCKSIVRSETVWNVHINAKQHKDNVAEAKRLKELTQNFTTPVKKRPVSPPLVPQKKIKGILKNSDVQSPFNVPVKKNPNVPNVITYHSEEIKRAALKPLEQLAKETEIAASSSTKVSSTSESLEVESKKIADVPIPEGFFDDPKLDAKARNIEYKDPVEEEWEKFQKEIKEEATASAELIAGEQEEATAERQIDEIDEQIRNWSRVLDLERKKEKTRKLNEEKAQKAIENDENDSESDDDIDEFLNWRSKKSFR